MAYRICTSRNDNLNLVETFDWLSIKRCQSKEKYKVSLTDHSLTTPDSCILLLVDDDVMYVLVDFQYCVHNVSQNYYSRYFFVEIADKLYAIHNL